MYTKTDWLHKTTKKQLSKENESHEQNATKKPPFPYNPRNRPVLLVTLMALNSSMPSMIGITMSSSTRLTRLGLLRSNSNASCPFSACTVACLHEDSGRDQEKIIRLPLTDVCCVWLVFLCGIKFAAAVTTTQQVCSTNYKWLDSIFLQGFYSLFVKGGHLG